MAIPSLALPIDIPWERICVSEDMVDANVGDNDRPAKWQSSIDVLAAESTDLTKKPTPKEMYTNAIVEGLDEAKTLAEQVKKVTN